MLIFFHLILIWLHATGSVGQESNHLDIDSSNSILGVVNSDAHLGDYITETDGDINVGLIHSETSDVDITADGSILNANGDTSSNNLEGNHMELVSTNGSIGETDLPLVIDSNGNVNMTVAKNITLIESVGDLESEYIHAGGNIDISVPTGDVIAQDIQKPGWMKLHVVQQIAEIWTQFKNAERRRYLEEFYRRSLESKVDGVAGEADSLIDGIGMRDYDALSGKAVMPRLVESVVMPITEAIRKMFGQPAVSDTLEVEVGLPTEAEKPVFKPVVDAFKKIFGKPEVAPVVISSDLINRILATALSTWLAATEKAPVYKLEGYDPLHPLTRGRPTEHFEDAPLPALPVVAPPQHMPIMPPSVMFYDEVNSEDAAAFEEVDSKKKK